MKRISIVILILLFTSCVSEIKSEKAIDIEDLTPITTQTIKADINAALNDWHKAAAEANFDNYFNLMTNDGVFIGTDATENWQNQAFRTFSKPYFDNGKAWNFKALNRNIYVYEDQKLAWFDELLDTQMKICRGSGVVKFKDNQWKVAHYVLSITIPNENTSEVIELKSAFDSRYTKKLRLKQ